MTIRHLRVFLAVAETGKMSAAAEQLYLSQPTVSQIIKELEHHYNVALFERYSQKLFITEAGRQLLEYAKQTVQDFDRMEAKMMDCNKQIPLRIGASISCGAITAKVVRDFEQTMPQQECYVCIGNALAIEQKLTRAQLDVGITQGRITSKELIAIPVIQDEMVIIAAPDHPITACHPVTPDKLAQYPFCVREAGCSSRVFFDLYMQSHRLSPRIKWEVTSPEAIKRAVMQNNCLAFISLRQVEAEVARGQLHLISSAAPEWKSPYLLVYHKDKEPTPAITAMQEILMRLDKPVYPDSLLSSKLV